MITVGQLLKKKGGEVWSITPDATVLAALHQMAEKNVGALVVMEGERLAGIFSERDYARSVVLKGRSTEETRVAEVMTAHVITVGAGQPVEDCMGLMTDRHIRHLPVLEGDRLAGIISIGDVVKEIIAEQQFTIQNLENYITGRKA